MHRLGSQEALLHVVLKEIERPLEGIANERYNSPQIANDTACCYSTTACDRRNYGLDWQTPFASQLLMLPLHLSHQGYQRIRFEVIAPPCGCPTLVSQKGAHFPQWPCMNSGSFPKLGWQGSNLTLCTNAFKVEVPLLHAHFQANRESC